MIRILSALALLASATPALAQSGFRAEPAAAPARAVIVTRDNVWHCAAGGCTAERASARPAIACAALVREVGALTSFRADDRALDAAELAACNRRARAD